MDTSLLTSSVVSDERPDHCPVCGAGAADPDHPNGACPRCGHLLWFVSRQAGVVTVVQLMNHSVALMELLDLLDRAILSGSAESGPLLINFGGIQQVSSAALGKLVKLMSHARQAKGRLALCELHPDLRHVFRITRLDAIFDLHDTEAEALEALARIHCEQAIL